MKNKLHFFIVIVTGFACLLSAQSASDGSGIMRKVYDRPAGNDMKASLTMTLRNARGDTRVRSIRQFLKTASDVEKKLMFFVEPADVRNTAFMNWSYTAAGKNDDQWIYLPALKRIKRISSSGKSDYFMGSDFTYDDLGDRHPDQDTHRLTGTENIDGKRCFVVESVPKEEGYMYSRTVTWVIDGLWVGLKKEFYNDKGKLLKTLRVKEYAEIDGYWTVTHTEMHNVQKNHTTIMKLADIKYDTGIADDLFSERTMQRGL
ncbi:MAG: outer membrane lipoprotein-sorting protein [Chitinispirillaceae bacterium]|nr:outer membrane lipoprotein-sorting protein [Chitinispirillaceae bacterium]